MTVVVPADGLSTNGLLPDAPVAAAERPAAALEELGAFNQWTKAWLVFLDLSVMAMAMGAAFWARRLLPDSLSLWPSGHMLVAILSLPWFGILFARYRLYNARSITSRLEEFNKVAHAVGAAALGMAIAGFFLRDYVSRTWLVFTFILGVAFMMIEREFVRRDFDRQRRAGLISRSVVVVGTNAEAIALATMMQDETRLGYRVGGFVSTGFDGVVGATIAADLPLLGYLDQIDDLLCRAHASGVLIATTAMDMAAATGLARRLTDIGVHVEMSSGLTDIAAQRLTIRPLGRFPMLYLEPVRRS